MSYGVLLVVLNPKLWMLNVRRLRLARGVSGRLVHEIVVPDGPDGRPGQRSLARDFDRSGSPLTSDIEPDVVAGEPAWRARFLLPSGAIGVLVRRGDDETDVAGLARRVLETWRWTRAAG